MSTDTPVRHTPQDLLERTDWKNYELIDGQLVEKNVSEDSAWIAGEILFRLRLSLEGKQNGWVFPEGTLFRCFPEHPDRVRKPDVSFIGIQRRPDGPAVVGYTEIAPDLVVEVVSPNDVAWEVSRKVDEWIQAGVTEAWVVMPLERNVTVYKRGEPTKLLNADDHIDFEAIPGFRCMVSEFFPPTPDSLQKD